MSIFDYPIEERKPGEIPSLETRHEANKKVDRKKRNGQIKEILKDFNKPMSAKSIAIEMKNRGYANTSERNLAAPRLTEMCQTGEVDEWGKGYCPYSDTKVTLYVLREG